MCGILVRIIKSGKADRISVVRIRGEVVIVALLRKLFHSRKVYSQIVINSTWW